MDDKVYVVDSSSEGSAVPSARSSAAASTDPDERGSIELFPPKGTARVQTPPCPRVTTTASTCTDDALVADPQREAILHENIMQLATLLPTPSHCQSKSRRTETHMETSQRLALQTAPPQGGVQAWRATLASLKRPRTPSEAAAPTTDAPVTMKREPGADEVPAWAAPLSSALSNLAALAARSTAPQTTEANAGATATPVCLLTPPHIGGGEHAARYISQTVGSSLSSSRVSTLEAEARLVVGREQATSLLPLYKELLHLRQEREHRVLDEAAHQKSALGMQKVLLEELETTCRQAMKLVASAFHERCATKPPSEYTIQALEEDVSRLQTLRTTIGAAPLLQPSTYTTANRPPTSSHLLPNDRRGPGKAGAACVMALEEMQSSLSQQNAELQARLNQLEETNRQLQERCASSARETADTAHRAGWVRKEVVLKLLSTKQQTLDAVTKALGWQVLSVSSDQVVLAGASAANEAERRTVNLTESHVPDDVPPSPPAEGENSVAEAATGGSGGPLIPPPDGPERESANADENEVCTPTGGDNSGNRPSDLDGGQLTHSAKHSEGEKASQQEELDPSSRSHNPEDEEAEVFSSFRSDESRHSPLLEDPGAPSEAHASPRSHFAENALDEPVRDTAQTGGRVRPNDDMEDSSELVNRTDETLVASMDDTNAAMAADVDSP